MTWTQKQQSGPTHTAEQQGSGDESWPWVLWYLVLMYLALKLSGIG